MTAEPTTVPDGRGDVEILLASLEVESISDLHRLVELGRATELNDLGRHNQLTWPAREVTLMRVLLRRYIAKATPEEAKLPVACALLDRLEMLG